MFAVSDSLVHLSGMNKLVGAWRIWTAPPLNLARFFLNSQSRIQVLEEKVVMAAPPPFDNLSNSRLRISNSVSVRLYFRSSALTVAFLSWYGRLSTVVSFLILSNVQFLKKAALAPGITTICPHSRELSFCGCPMKVILLGVTLTLLPLRRIQLWRRSIVFRAGSSFIRAAINIMAVSNGTTKWGLVGSLYFSNTFWRS